MINRDPRDVYGELLEKAEAKNIPLWAHIDLSYRCNLSCVHCYCQGLSSGFSGGKSELMLDEWKNAIDQLAAAGALHLSISGGEVLLHPGFFDIARHAKERHFCLTLFTNGTLIDEETADRFRELAPRSVDLSIYGATADIHDSITRSPGSFDRTVRAVRFLKERGLRVVLKSSILEQNYRQADQIEIFSRSLGADDYMFNIEISPKNDGSRDPQKCRMSAAAIRYFMKDRITVDEEAAYRYPASPLDRPLCAMGSMSCYVSPYGDIYPCIQLLRPMGNIRESSFSAIWNARSRLRDELGALKTYGDLPACRACEYVKVCRLCPGLAFMETGDMRKCYNALRLMSQIEYEMAFSKKRGNNG